jgi:hypothetical protein
MAITNGYCSLSEVKSALRIVDSLDDSLLEMAIESASREIDGGTNRYFYNAGSATKLFVAADEYVVFTEDLQSVSKFETDSAADGSFTEWASTQYQLEPLNGKADGIALAYSNIRAIDGYALPQYNGQALIRVTGVWGWASVPVAIRQATVILASRIFKRLDSPLGIAGFGDMGAMRVSRFDPDVEQLIAPYRTMRNLA